MKSLFIYSVVVLFALAVVFMCMLNDAIAFLVSIPAGLYLCKLTKDVHSLYSNEEKEEKVKEEKGKVFN